MSCYNEKVIGNTVTIMRLADKAEDATGCEVSVEIMNVYNLPFLHIFVHEENNPDTPKLFHANIAEPCGFTAAVAFFNDIISSTKENGNDLT